MVYDRKGVDKCYEEFLKTYKTACDLYIPSKECEARELKCKCFNKNIKSVSKQKNKL